VSYGDWAISARKRWLWGLLTASILLALVALAIAALIATVDGNGYALVVLALALAGAYLSGRACARIPNVALRIDPEQVSVIGPLRTLHVLTRHAEAFVPEVRPTVIGSQPTIVLRHDAYRSIPLWMFARFASSTRTEDAVSELAQTAGELNDALRNAKGEVTPSSIPA
jgi:hypothetical protein